MIGFRSLKTVTMTAVLAGTLAVGGAAGLLAQDDSEATMGPVHPAHIHAGTCDDLDPNPAAPLTDVTMWMNDTDDETENTPQGSLTAPMLLRSETDVEMSLDDLLATSYAINVHESAENIQNYVACGEIGGIVVDDDGDTLAVAISPLNDSGVHGIAFLEGDDDSTNVKVWLAEPRVEEEPAATPAS
jgi:hypothetical protein